jgi:hypothetical protein
MPVVYPPVFSPGFRCAERLYNYLNNGTTIVEL